VEQSVKAITIKEVTNKKKLIQSVKNNQIVPVVSSLVYDIEKSQTIDKSIEFDEFSSSSFSSLQKPNNHIRHHYLPSQFTHFTQSFDVNKKNQTNFDKANFDTSYSIEDTSLASVIRF
jgi:hypothetical protein